MLNRGHATLKINLKYKIDYKIMYIMQFYLRIIKIVPV